MKNYYFAITDIIGCKQHSFVLAVPEHNELLGALKRCQTYQDDNGNSYVATDRYVSIMPTKKKAIEVVKNWNTVDHEENRDFYQWAYKHNCIVTI